MDVLKKEFEYFLVLCETLNISEAAYLLGIKQAGLSKSLANLETTMGERLFYRTNRGLKKTEKAESLQKKVLKIKDFWGEEEEKKVQGIIKMGAHPIIGKITFPQFFPKLIQDYPLLDLQLVLKTSHEITRAVIEHQIDIGVVANPQPHLDLVIQPIREEFIGVYGKASEKVLFYNPEMINIAKSLRGFRGYRQVPVADYQLLKSITERSHGVCLMPSAMMEKDNKLNLIKKLPGKVEICVAYRYDRVKTLTFQTVLDAIKTVVR